MQYRVKEQKIMKTVSNKLPKDLTILDTRDRYGYPGSYKDYKCDCREQGRRPAKEDSEKYFDWLADNVNENIECLFSNMTWAHTLNGTVIVREERHLWNGVRKGYSVFTSENLHIRYTNKSGVNVYGYEHTGLEKAIRRLVSERDIMDWVLRLEDGDLVLYCYHHDGCNIYYINPLSVNGEKTIGRDDFWMKERKLQRSWYKLVHPSDIDF